MGCFTGSGTAAPGTEKKKQKKNCRDAEGGCLIIFICLKYSFLCQKCLSFLLKVSLFDLFKSLDRKYSAFIVWCGYLRNGFRIRLKWRGNICGIKTYFHINLKTRWNLSVQNNHLQINKRSFKIHPFWILMWALREELNYSFVIILNVYKV